ncbi:MAG: acyltransferase [Lacisediminihabitans sp.]
MSVRSLGQVFQPKHNALNALRLLLALSVIIWHSFPLSGVFVSFAAGRQLLGHIGVDSFFAISGFLIMSSWIRRPHWKSFLRARVLRIFPAFWVCLVVTAVVFAPLSLVLRHQAFPPDFVAGAISYVVKNAGLYIFDFGIAGTPTLVPYPGVWDGALWTLMWEFLCYLALLVLGIVGLLRWKTVTVVLFAIALLGVIVTSYGPVENYFVVNGSPLGLMFIAGALMYQFQERVPVSRTLIVLAAVIVLGSSWLPEYRVIAALPLAYLVIVLGALGSNPRLSITNDFSYGTYIYGFPVAQLLASAGAVALGVPAFAILSIAATIPLAALSWFLIEKPSLRLKNSRRPVLVVDGTHTTEAS